MADPLARSAPSAPARRPTSPASLTAVSASAPRSASSALPGAATRAVGPARVLALAYGFFVLAAGARSGVQIATKFSHAPLAYVLSAVSAVVYTAGLVVLVLADRDPGRRRHWALWIGIVELAGVLVIGLASVLDPGAFPDATVWSGFGVGYGYVPLALPVLAMTWALHPRTRGVLRDMGSSPDGADL